LGKNLTQTNISGILASVQKIFNRNMDVSTFNQKLKFSLMAQVVQTSGADVARLYYPLETAVGASD
jgi:hypothetical protein